MGELLPASADKYANRLAVASLTEESLTYSALAEKAGQLSQILAQAGIGKGDRVGLIGQKAPEMVAAIFGVLAIGGAYVPADVYAPLERARFIFGNCQTAAIFCDRGLGESALPENISGYEKFSLPDFPFDLFCCTYQSGLSPEFPEDLAYILYTSGSTGRPKGVMIGHENALVFVNWSRHEFSVTETDVVTSIAPFHFDLSIFDLFVSLSSGACLLLVEAKAAKNPLLLAEILVREKVTLIYATPTLFQLLLRYGKLNKHDYSALRLFLYAGEVFPVPALSELMTIWAHVQGYNLYGPTETNVVTYHRLQTASIAEMPTEIPIGQACPFAECRLWEDGFIPETAGAYGELWVAGKSLAAGYLDSTATGKVFVQESGKRWYRTGDIVTVDDHANYRFVGRRDRMVKRRGYRIEPAEIEGALRKHPAVADCIAIAYHDKKQEVKICVFYQLQADHEKPGMIALKMHSQGQLPLYMVPDAFKVIDAFPLTSSQKIDYQRLEASLHE